jgi:protein SCO1/2
VPNVSSESIPSAPARGLGRWVKSPYPWALLLGIVTLTLIRPLLRHEPPPPPVLGELPAFALTTADGAAFGLDDMRGRVWLVDFFFTRCGSICPRLTAAMHGLEERLATAEVGLDVQLLSITVDPDNDTAEVLRAYARDHDADPRRWTFLTGDRDAVAHLVEQGFRTPVGAPRQDDAGWIDIAHSGRIVLVDRAGRVRGYYDADEPGLDEAFHRARHVLREPLVE